MRTVVVSIVVAGLLSGCIGVADEAGTLSPSALLAGGNAALLEKGGYAVEQQLDVFLVGFAPGTGAALQARLAPEEVNHLPFSFMRTFPPDPSSPKAPLSSEDYPNPTLPTAVYKVRELEAAASASILGSLAALKVEGSDGILDGNAAEAALAEALTAAGFTLDPNRPAYVVLHGGDALAKHAWRYTYSHGYLEPVRTFGERLPLLVTDVSAEPDPYVVEPDTVDEAMGGGQRGKAYDQKLAADGAATLDALEDLAIDATHYRFLKGPIYPITTKPCHHITLLLAVHTTALTQYAPGLRAPEEWVDVEGLTQSFTNLTGDPVHVELKVLRLPQDEPALDVLARGAGAFVTLDALRWYLDENFAKFVTAMPACEEYLSLLIFGDVAQQGAFGGIGTYDVKRSHRISFSLVPETSRLTDRSGEVQSAAGRADPSRFQPNWVNLLFAHEVGHTLGQHHPQHLSKARGSSAEVNSFESVWSVMSYQTRDRIHDFGLNDRAQWQRNRLGYAFAEAQALGQADAAEVLSGLEHARMSHWDTAYDALVPLLGAVAGDAPAAAGSHDWLFDYHVVDQHDHPWFDDVEG